MQEAIRNKILTLLDQHRIMTVATLRPDGWPQATTVGYVNEGLTLYFLCGLESQKAKNLALDDRISLTIDHETADLMKISGLSMAAHARAVNDRAEAEKTQAEKSHATPLERSMAFAASKGYGFTVEEAKQQMKERAAAINGTPPE